MSTSSDTKMNISIVLGVVIVGFIVRATHDGSGGVQWLGIIASIGAIWALVKLNQ